MSAQTMLETLVAASGNAWTALIVKATVAMLAALLLVPDGALGLELGQHGPDR